jgi:hypothetical protein
MNQQAHNIPYCHVPFFPSFRCIKVVILARLDYVRKWIYFCYEAGEEKNVTACVSVISKQYCASAYHCFPKAIDDEKFKIINVNADPDDEEDWKHIQVF